MAKAYAAEPANAIEQGYQLYRNIGRLYTAIAMDTPDGNIPGSGYANYCSYYAADGIIKFTNNVKYIENENPTLVYNNGTIPPNAMKYDVFYLTIGLTSQGMIPGYSHNAKHCFCAPIGTGPPGTNGNPGVISNVFYWIVS